ncbi:MAG: aminotransferase class IV [Lentimicrobiaceae bacterium]
MYRFFETIKIINGSLQYIDYHQRRMTNTLNRNYVNAALPSLTDMIEVPSKYSSGLVKCKVEYNDCQFRIFFDFYKPRIVNSLKLIACDDINYNYKYCDRQLLNELFNKKANYDDILIVKYENITDTSFSNIAFSDGEKWYTPSSLLLPGTARARMIETGLLIEKNITVYNFREFEYFVLINSMLENRFSDKKPVSAIAE